MSPTNTDDVLMCHPNVLPKTYAVVVDQECVLTGFTEMVPHSVELHGDYSAIWDALSQYLTLRYVLHPDDDVPMEEVLELLDVYYGSRDILQEAMVGFNHFMTTHISSLQHMLYVIHENQERIEAIYPAGMDILDNHRGVLLFECWPKTHYIAM